MLTLKEIWSIAIAIVRDYKGPCFYCDMREAMSTNKFRINLFPFMFLFGES